MIMKKLFLIALMLLGAVQLSALSSQGQCKVGQSWQCIAEQPPALGVFCGCASTGVKSIAIIPSGSNEPWNSCLTCQ